MFRHLVVNVFRVFFSLFPQFSPAFLFVLVADTAVVISNHQETLVFLLFWSVFDCLFAVGHLLSVQRLHVICNHFFLINFRQIVFKIQELSVNFDRLFVEILYDAPYLLKVELVWKSFEQILQKSLMEVEHFAHAKRIIGFCRSFVTIQVLFSDLTMHFLENVTDGSQRDWNVLLSGNTILTHWVVDDWKG